MRRTRRVLLLPWMERLERRLHCSATPPDMTGIGNQTLTDVGSANIFMEPGNDSGEDGDFPTTPDPIIFSEDVGFIASKDGTISDVLAHFMSSSASGALKATIDWGDGSGVEPGVITSDGNGWYDVSGKHVYQSKDGYGITIDVSDGSFDQQTYRNALPLADELTPMQGAVGGAPLSEVANVPAFGSFIDLSPGDPSSYLAQIDWGDGTTSVGSVSGPSFGLMTVSGSHAYPPKLADYPLTMTVTKNGTTITMSGTASIITDAAWSGDGPTDPTSPPGDGGSAGGDFENFVPVPVEDGKMLHEGNEKTDAALLTRPRLSGASNLGTMSDERMAELVFKKDRAKDLWADDVPGVLE